MNLKELEPEEKQELDDLVTKLKENPKGKGSGKFFCDLYLKYQLYNFKGYDVKEYLTVIEDHMLNYVRIPL